MSPVPLRRAVDRLGPIVGLVPLLWATLLWQPALAQLAPPPVGPTLSSREWAAQAPPIEGLYAYKSKLRQYVKDKRLDVLHPHFEEQADALAQGRVSDDIVARMFNMVAAAEESEASLFDQWTDAYPQSHVGPLARGHFNLHRAWQARGNKLARDTSTSEFEEMHRWLPLARRDAQLALQRQPRCSLCYALLIQLSMPLRLRKEARDWLNQGLAANRDSIAVPNAYYESIDPRWGGSVDQQRALVQMLKLAGHHRAERRLQAKLLAEAIDYRTWRSATQAEQGLAAARDSLAVDGTYLGRYVEAYALQQLDRHADALAAFARIVAEYDSPAEVFTARAYSYAKLERWPEAVRDLRVAYEQFLSPWAFETLVRLSAGNSGWKLRSSPGDAGELCREAALRGLPIAMTCLGGLHYFGTGGVANDFVQARQWFQRAAQAGDPQGMMDLAQMCATGQGGALDRDQAIRWWIGAAQREHPQARAKLDSELSYFERLKHVLWPQFESRAGDWLHSALRLLQIFLAR